MRILHLLPHLSGGGAERQFSYLAPELVRRGHEVHVAYSTNGPNRPDLPGVVLHQLASRSHYDPYLLWQLVRLIRRIQPDIAHTWILQMHILGGLAARLTGVPCVFREPSSPMGPPRTWKTRLRFHAASWARAIVSNSRGGDDLWKNRVPNSRRFVIPNGLPLLEIENTAAALPPNLASPETPIVLYVGRLASDGSGEKNLKPLLEALAAVSQQRKLSGIICGDGPQRAELEALRHTLGLDADVHFTGYLSATAVWALMKKATVLVSLSAFEGCPNVVMEAMACGCPLILSDIPAHREILDEHSTLFVDPSDTRQAAAAILSVLQGRDSSEERALIAKQKAHKWSIAEMARSYESVYDKSS